MESGSIPKGRGRGRFITKNSFQMQPDPAPLPLSQYILPDENSNTIREEDHENFEDFKQYDLERICAEEKNNILITKTIHDANNNYPNSSYEKIASAISFAAVQAANVCNVKLETAPVDPYKFKKPQAKKSWNVFQSNDSDDDSCKICDRSDKTVFCKTCGHSWKGRQRIKCEKHPSTVMLMDSLNCPECHSVDLKEI